VKVKVGTTGIPLRSFQDPRYSSLPMLRRFNLLHKLALGLLIPALLLVSAEIGLRLLARLAPPSAGLYDGYEETLVEIGGFEDTSRLFEPDPELFWRLRKGVRSLHWEPPLWLDNRSNSLGFRDPERSLSRQDPCLRILCIGDSCTYGSGVRLADSYPQQLEALLAERFHDRLVEVFNAGVPGSSSDQGAVFLEQRAAEIQPDLVLIALGINDARHWDLGHHHERGHGLCRTDRDNRQLLQHPYLALDRKLSRSHLYRGLRRLIGPSSLPTGEAAADDAGQVRVPDSQYRDNLLRMAAACRNLGATPVFLLWPIKGQLFQVIHQEGLQEETHYQRSLIEVAAKQQVLLVHLIEALRDEVEPPLYVDSVHMNAAGCREVALRVALALYRNELLPPPPTPR
jgi:lysophospholipase L1-like esterase